MALLTRLRFALCCMALALGPSAHGFTFSQKDAGAQAHPLVVARHGGLLPNVALQDYVASVGQRLARVSPQPEEAWTFTILDDPDIRAFAQPGGYIYISRGLVGFAISEAEIASVIAHQMAHLTRNHLGRISQPKFGSILAPGAALDGLVAVRAESAPNSPPSLGGGGAAPVLTPEQEAVAARDGILMLSKANYPSSAARDLAMRLIAQDRAGAGPQVLMLGITPDDRAAASEAIIAASASSTVFEADPRKDAYLQNLQGLIWGASAEQGFVRGRRFLHPALAFTFEAPEGFTLDHTPAEVVATGPGGAVMVLDVADSAGPRLESYVRDTWAPSLTRDVEAGYLYDVRSLALGGLEAATAFQPYEDDDGAKVAQLTAIRTETRVYRFRAIAPVENIDASLAMEDALQSFRLLSAAEAAAEKPRWLHIHEVQPGDSVNLFAAAMPGRAQAEARFRRLNGLSENMPLLVGSLIKMVME